jgi:uncharacterized protein (TIGR02594 family)
MEPRELMWFELMKYYGLKEVPGPVDNPIIVSWFKELGYPEIQDDETAWCSLAMNIMAIHCGLEHSGMLTAKSWMKVGKHVSDPGIGDIVVFYRGTKTSWQGHVGLFAGYNKERDKIISFGGNQNNMIGFYPYPVFGVEMGLLGFRKLNFI